MAVPRFDTISLIVIIGRIPLPLLLANNHRINLEWSLATGSSSSPLDSHIPSRFLSGGWVEILIREVENNDWRTLKFNQLHPGWVNSWKINWELGGIFPFTKPTLSHSTHADSSSPQIPINKYFNITIIVLIIHTMECRINKIYWFCSKVNSFLSSCSSSSFYHMSSTMRDDEWPADHPDHNSRFFTHHPFASAFVSSR